MKVKPTSLFRPHSTLIAAMTLSPLITTIAVASLPVAPPMGVTHPGIQLQSTAVRFPLCCDRLIRSMAVADLNGDGHEDLVTGSDNLTAVAVSLSDGQGGFLEGIHLPLPVDGESLGNVRIATGDANGDGHLDIVAAGYMENGVAILPGDGSGAFGSPITVAVDLGGETNAVAFADMNGDGAGDIVLTRDGRVTLLLADGAGGFAPPAHFPINGWPYPGSVAVADVDGDGHLDVATVHAATHDVSIVHGDGQGGLLSPMSISVGLYAAPTSVVFADVNGDGYTDIVTTNSGLDGSPNPPQSLPGSVSVIMNDGHGGFHAAVQYPAGAGEGRAEYVVVGDITGDGHDDIVFDRPLANTVGVLLGSGDGLFGKAISIPNDGGGPVALIDAAGDGQLEIVVANAVESNLQILRSDGAKANFMVGAAPSDMTTLDLNDDGYPDVITVNFLGDDLSVRLGDGRGGFLPEVRHAVGRAPYSIAVGDINGDGRHDLVVANRGSNTISVLLGDGQGRFADARELATGVADGEPWDAVLGDVNGDGHLDIATANANYFQPTVSVFIGGGNGEFAAPAIFPLGDGEGTAFPQAMTIADATGDGHADLVIANIGFGGKGGNLLLLRGDGSGGFAAPMPLATDAGPVAVAAADLDGDGILDLVSLNTTAQNISVLLGDGLGGFASSTEYPIALLHDFYGLNPFPWRFALADVDGDSHLDVVTANTQTSTVSVVRNEGTGVFDEFHVVDTGYHPYSVAIADVDGDGRMDVISANQGNNNFSVLFNRADTLEDSIFSNGFDSAGN